MQEQTRKRVTEMIVGVGNDIIEIERIKTMLGQQFGAKFLERVLTTAEREIASQRGGLKLGEFVAGRFAAKEAVVKALGCGIGSTVGFQDINITPNLAGKPECMLSTAAQARLELDSITQIHISISHSKYYAAAIAVVEV